MEKEQKQNEPQSGFFQIIKRDFFSIPVSIRMISLSVFLFVFGRGLGADTFFSVYIQSIVDNVFWVAIIGAILSFSKLVFTIPIGNLNDHSDISSIITMSKIFFVCSAFLYFFAGIFSSFEILIFAVIINGFASASMYTSYQSYVRRYAKKQQRCTSFGLFFSSSNLAIVFGALISSVLVGYIRLPYLFLFVVLFSVASVVTDQKIKYLKKKKLKAFFMKESFIHQFFREVFSFSAFKEVIVGMKKYSKNLRSALFYEFLFNVLDFVGFLFIPIVAIANHLNLSQIAIIFAVMRTPYIISFFTAEVADRYNKKLLTYVILFFLSFLYILLGFQEGFGSILILSFGIAMGLSILRPIISGLVSDHTPKKNGGILTGATEFVGRFGHIVGSIVFGALSAIVGIQVSFILIGTGLFFLSIFQITRKGPQHRKAKYTPAKIEMKI